MKNFGKIWWIFGIIDVIIALLDPYIGFFGLFNFIGLFITFCLDLNLISRERVLKRNEESKLVSIQFKSLAILAYVVATFIFIFKMFTCLGFLAAYLQNIVVTPIEIWSNPKQMGVVLLIIGIIFNVLSLISYICRGKSFRKLGKKYDEQINAKNTVVGD